MRRRFDTGLHFFNVLAACAAPLRLIFVFWLEYLPWSLDEVIPKNWRSVGHCAYMSLLCGRHYLQNSRNIARGWILDSHYAVQNLRPITVTVGSCASLARPHAAFRTEAGPIAFPCGDTSVDPQNGIFPFWLALWSPAWGRKVSNPSLALSGLHLAQTTLFSTSWMPMLSHRVRLFLINMI